MNVMSNVFRVQNKNTNKSSTVVYDFSILTSISLLITVNSFITKFSKFSQLVSVRKLLLLRQRVKWYR